MKVILQMPIHVYCEETFSKGVPTKLKLARMTPVQLSSLLRKSNNTSKEFLRFTTRLTIISVNYRYDDERRK